MQGDCVGASGPSLRSMDFLCVDGEVERSRNFDFKALAGLSGQEEDLSRLVPGREGGAVRFATLLEQVRPSEAASHVTLTSADGDFQASVPLAALGDALIAYRDGNQALPADRGGPFRFFIPQSAACHTAEVDQCANVKFLASIRLTVGRGEDSRPTNPTEHAALHTHEED